MGCAQSSPSRSSQDKQRRNSREFYHQYNQNPARHQHAFVNTKPIKPVQNIPVTSSRSVTPSRSAAPSPGGTRSSQPTSPIHCSPPTVPPLAGGYVVSDRDVDLIVPNGSPTKRANSPSEPSADIQFRRQHFDRNSVLRHSKKRSRKASNASINSPAAKAAVANAAAGNSSSSPGTAAGKPPVSGKSPEKRASSAAVSSSDWEPVRRAPPSTRNDTPVARNTGPGTRNDTTPVGYQRRPSTGSSNNIQNNNARTTTTTNLRSQVERPQQRNDALLDVSIGSSSNSTNYTTPTSHQVKSNQLPRLSASENVAALLMQSGTTAGSINASHVFSEESIKISYPAVADDRMFGGLTGDVSYGGGSDRENNSTLLNGSGSNSSSGAPHVDEDGARLI